MYLHVCAVLQQEQCFLLGQPGQEGTGPGNQCVVLQADPSPNGNFNVCIGYHGMGMAILRVWGNFGLGKWELGRGDSIYS